MIEVLDSLGSRYSFNASSTTRFKVVQSSCAFNAAFRCNSGTTRTLKVPLNVFSRIPLA